ncbi:uncharacterized protein LOC106172920 [Lingula anatina]|uniref:Uncharacterized protein LOC106172920 n=1 Tax=Lingula anatina TaxID=7574 RepID=A0A1S3JGM9_LINAN|nr:uncharacterized protein LOC106172920 [Lingula anatina]|eukprot:XP_013409301.1 uncharacterized protein LOC106172920 [Lingula anatina]
MTAQYHHCKPESKIIAVPNLHGHYAYIITVKTGLRKNAGTNAKIKMELCSKHLKSQEYLLKDHGTKQNIFSRGKETMFLVYSTVPLGELSHVLIIQEGHGVKGKWHLDSVIVSDPQADREWLFSCNKWLKPQRTSKEGPATHTLALVDAGRTFCLIWSSILCFFRQYHRWIYPFFGSGQDSNKVLSRPLTLVMLFSAVGNSLLGNMLVETALLTISSQIAVELTTNIFFFTFLINTIICLINCLCEIVLGNIRSEELCQDIFTGKSSSVQHKVVTNRNQRKAHHMEKLTKAQSWSASQVQHIHSKDSSACSFKSRVDVDSKQSSIFPPKSRSQIFYDHERKICGSIQRSRSSSEVYILSGNRNNNNTASCSSSAASNASDAGNSEQGGAIGGQGATKVRQMLAVFPVVEDWSYQENVWEDELSNYIQLSGEQYQLKDHVQASVQTVSLHSLEKKFDEDQHKPLKVTQDIGAQTGTSLLDLKLKQKKSGYVYGRNLTKTSSTASVNHLREAIQVNLALVQRRQDAALGKLRANMTSDPASELTASDEKITLTEASEPSPYLSLGELVAKIIADDVNAGSNVNKCQADFPEEITEATLKDFTLGTTHGLLASFYDVCDVATEASQKAMQDFSKKLVDTLVQLISAEMNGDMQGTAKRHSVKDLEKDDHQPTQCMDREVQFPHTLVGQVNNLMKQEMQDIRKDKAHFIKEVFNYHYVDSLISNAIIRAQFAVFHCAESKSQDLDWPDKEHVIAKAADLLKEDVLTFYDEKWDECSDSVQLGLLSQNAEGDVFLDEQDLKVAIVNDAKMVAKSVATSVLKQAALCSDINCESDSSVLSTDIVQFKEEFKDLRNLVCDLSLERRARSTESWPPRRSLSLDSMKNPPGSSEATLWNFTSTSTLRFKSFEDLGVLKRQPTWGELRADISSSLRFEDDFVTAGTVDINDNSQVVQVNNTAELSPEVQDDECDIETSGPSAMNMTISSPATVYLVNEVMSTVSVKEDKEEEKDLKDVDKTAFPLCLPSVVDIDIEAALPREACLTTPVSATTVAPMTGTMTSPWPDTTCKTTSMTGTMTSPWPDTTCKTTSMTESMTAPVPEVMPAEMTTPVTATYQIENEVTAQKSVEGTRDLADEFIENYVFSSSSTSSLSAIITEELDAAYSRDIQSCDISASVDDSVADVQDSGKQSASIVNDLPEDKYDTTEIIPTSALDSSLQGNFYDVAIQVEEDNPDEDELTEDQSDEEYKPLSDKELLHLERMVKGEFKKSFPHWVKYIVFIFLFCSIMLSFSLTAIYGMSLPEDHVNHWLMLVGLSLLEDFFIFQPIKCFCVQFYFFLFPMHKNRFPNPV